MSLDQIFKSFSQFLQEEKGKSRKTLTTYREQLAPFLSWLGTIGVENPSQIGLAHVDDYLRAERQRQNAARASKPGEQLSPNTIVLKARVIRRFLSYCEEQKLLSADLSDFIATPRVVTKHVQVLKHADVKALLEQDEEQTPDSLCDQAILELAYSSGLRPSELQNLRLSDLLGSELSRVHVGTAGRNERNEPIGRKAAVALKSYLSYGRPRLVSQQPLRNRRDMPSPSLRVIQRVPPNRQ